MDDCVDGVFLGGPKKTMGPLELGSRFAACGAVGFVLFVLGVFSMFYSSSSVIIISTAYLLTWKKR